MILLQHDSIVTWIPSIIDNSFDRDHFAINDCFVSIFLLFGKSIDSDSIEVLQFLVRKPLIG